MTLRFVASEDDRRATTFSLDAVELRHRTTVRGPRAAVQEVMLKAGEAPDGERLDWYCT